MQIEISSLNRAVYSVDDLLSIVPISRTCVYAAVRSGRLRRTKIGRRTVFMASDVAAYLAALRDDTGRAPA